MKADIQGVAKKLAFKVIRKDQAWVTEDDLRIIEVRKIDQNFQVTLAFDELLDFLFIVTYVVSLDRATVRTYQLTGKTTVHNPFTYPRYTAE